MTRDALFSKPAWAHFRHVADLHAMPLPALLAADAVFDQIRQTGRIQPGPSDYAAWARALAESEAIAWLTDLEAAFRVLMSSEVPQVAAARAMIERERKTAPAIPEEPPNRLPADWDPCARVDRPRARRVSVYPWELPGDWQDALHRAARGLPRGQVRAPCRDILKRMLEKLCQLAWSALEAGLPVELAEATIDPYLAALETRLRARPHGIRWATMRATAEDLHRFARYLGAPDATIAHLRHRLSRYELYERGQDALKFYALLETGNTTLRVLAKADALLEQAAQEPTAAARHRLRNAGAILGLYSIVPLRNANAELTFGKTLLRSASTWVIDMPIQKTRHSNPDHLVVPLEPEFARYIDIVLQGDHDPRHLPELRARALQTSHLLILHHNGSRPSAAYIPFLFKKHTGNSFTTTRTMLHTDQAVCRGDAGTRDAMVMAHQGSPRTAARYQAKAVRSAAIARVQHASTTRRDTLATEDVLDALAAIKTQAGMDE